MQNVRIPRRIDDPPHLLLWSADELAPMLIGLLIGVIIDKALICVFAGWLVTSAYRRFRDNAPDGYFLHVLYSYGFLFTKARSLVNPYIKRFFP